MISIVWLASQPVGPGVDGPSRGRKDEVEAFRDAHPVRPEDRGVDDRALALQDRGDDPLAVDRVHHGLAQAGFACR